MSLREAYELIRDETHWTQQALFRDKYGHRALDPDEATTYCASGAMVKCGTSDKEIGALFRVIPALFPEVPEDKKCFGAVAWVNDVLGHEAVVQMFEKALIEVEGSL